MTTPTLPAGLVDAFARARRILFITGAGISADSGLPTYRGFGGLYDGKPTEEGPGNTCCKLNKAVATRSPTLPILRWPKSSAAARPARCAC